LSSEAKSGREGADVVGGMFKERKDRSPRKGANLDDLMKKDGGRRASIRKERIRSVLRRKTSSPPAK